MLIKESLGFLPQTFSQPRINFFNRCSWLWKSVAFTVFAASSNEFPNDKNNKKWLLFSENALGDLTDSHKLESAKLLLNLFEVNESSQFIDILIKNLENMEKNTTNHDNQTNNSKNEILFLVFSLLSNEDQNPFTLNREVDVTVTNT